jgi:hypothetical protein
VRHGRKGGNSPDPLSLPSASVQATDRRELARACPQCPDAKTSPHQHAPKAAAPGLARRTSPDTRPGHLLDSPFRPIKSPSEHTIEPTPSPATSQTTFLPSALSRSQLPSTPASSWTRVAPPRSATVGRTDGGKWRRSAAGTFSALRRQALLPLRPSPSTSSSLLHAGELPPSPMETTPTRRWIRIQQQHTGSVT